MKKNRFAKNSMAVGLVTLIVTAGLSFSANGATNTRYVAHAEARYLAGTSGLGDIANTISQNLEGESADCSTAEVQAGDCNKVEENNDIAIPIGNLGGLSLGAVDNYAGANSSETSTADNPNSLASSGVVGDNGFIDPDYDGPKGSVTVSLADGTLTGPIGQALTNVTAEMGAVSAEAKATKGDVSRRYNIASAKLTATLEILDTINTQLEDALEGYNLLGTLSGTDAITLSKLSEVAPPALKPILDAIIGPISDNLVDIELAFPSVDDLTASLADFSENGVTIDVSTGNVSVDLVALLDSLHLDINNLPPGTDLLAYALPAITSGLDEIVNNLFDTVIDQIVSQTSLEVTPLPILGLLQPVTLSAADLGALLDPLRAGLNDLLSGPTGLAGELASSFTTALAPDALAQVLQLNVNNHDLYGEELVAGDVVASSPNAAISETALRVRLLGGQLADLRLGNAVVVPDSTPVVTDEDDGAQAAVDGAQNDDTQSTVDDAVDDGTNNATDGSDTVADADADADVARTLPDTGAPNLLPLWIMGLAFVMFGGAILLNEKRRKLLS